MRDAGVALIACALGLPASASQATRAQHGPARKARPSPPASRELEAAVKRDPRNPKLLRRARPRLLGPERVSRARSRRFSARSRSGRRPPKRTTGSAWRLSEKADLPGAIAELQEGGRARSRSTARAYTNLGSALATSGDFAEAVAVFQKALALEPEQPRART